MRVLTFKFRHLFDQMLVAAARIPLRVGLARLRESARAAGKATTVFFGSIPDYWRKTGDFVFGPSRSARRRYLPTGLAAAAGLALTAIGFYSADGFYQDEARRDFDRPAAQYAGGIAKSIDRYLEVVNSIGAFMAAAKEFDRWEFFSLAKKSLPRYPGLEAIAWIPKVAGDQRDVFESEAQRDGLYGFRFTASASGGRPVPAEAQPFHYPLYYVEPFDGNQHVLGLDLAAVDEAVLLLDSAAETGQMQATRRLDLWQSVRDEAAFVTLLPIFTQTPAKDGGEADKQLIGFVLGLIRIGEVIEEIAADINAAAGLDVVLLDADADPGRRLLYVHGAANRDQRPTGLSERTAYDGMHSELAHTGAGRRWSIVIKPAPGFFGNEVNLVPWGVAAIGFLLTAFLLQYTISSAIRTRVIEQTVAQRTSELVSTNAALEREMDERSRTEQARLDLERELAQIQKMESLGTLAGGIAHEINTPIQYVGENLHFVQECIESLEPVLTELGRLEPGDGFGEDRKDLRHLADTIARVDIEFLENELPASIAQSLEGIDRISEIVLAIKEFSHPDAKEKRVVDLNHALVTTITVARNQWKYVAEVETDFDPDLDQVPCFPGELHQVFLNLIVNAAHAIEARGSREKGTISITTRRVGDHATIRVSDTGIGIHTDIREKIFDPFFTTKEPGKGTGQGLAISHSIVTKKHGGSIAVSSDPGRGATFTVSLPLSDAAQPEEAA